MRLLLISMIAVGLLIVYGCPRPANKPDTERYSAEQIAERYEAEKSSEVKEPEYSTECWHDYNWTLIPMLITETGVDGWIENGIYIGSQRAAFTTLAGITGPGKLAMAETERYLAENPIKAKDPFSVGGDFNPEHLLSSGLDLFFVLLSSQKTIMRTTKPGTVITEIRPTFDRNGLFIYEVGSLSGSSFGLTGEVTISRLDAKGREHKISQPRDWFLAENVSADKSLLITPPSLRFEDSRLLLKRVPDKAGAIWEMELDKMTVPDKTKAKPEKKAKSKAKAEDDRGKITPVTAPINAKPAPDFSALAWIEQVQEDGVNCFQLFVTDLVKNIDYQLYQGRFPPKRPEWTPQMFWLDNRRIVTMSYRTDLETGTKSTLALIVLNLEDPLHPKVIANDLIEGPKLIVHPSGQYVGYTTIEFSGYGPCFGLRVARTDQEAGTGQLLYMSHPSVKLFYPFEWRPDGRAILSEVRVPTPEAGKIKAQLLEFVLEYKPDSRPKPMLAPPSIKAQSGKSSTGASKSDNETKDKESSNPLQRPAEDMITD